MKNKRVVYNLVSSITYRIVVMVLSFLISHIYLVNFGSEVNGVVSTIKQVFSYLSLLEAGVGLASTQALYGPVANEDKGKINGILSATNYFYRRTGFLYGSLVIGVGLLYSVFIKSEVDSLTIFLLTVIYGMPGVLRFWIVGKYRVLLEVEGKGYVVNYLAMFSEVFSSLLRVFLLYTCDSLVIIQSIYCLDSIIQVCFFFFYIRKNYKWLNFRVKPNFGAISQKGAVLIHQVSGVVFSNTDVFLLSLMCDFKTVSVYTVYNLFYHQSEVLLSMVTSGISFRLGQMYQVNKEKFEKVFSVYQGLFTVLIFTGYSLFEILLIPIVKIYTGGVSDANYLDSKLLTLIVLVGLLSGIKYPLTQVISFSGDFKNTEKYAVIEMVLNISLSVILIKIFGIYGGLLGTIIALVYRYIVTLRFVYMNILKNGLKVVGYRLLAFFAVFVLICSRINPLCFIEKGVLEVVFLLIKYGVVFGGVYLCLDVICNFRNIVGIVRRN